MHLEKALCGNFSPIPSSAVATLQVFERNIDLQFLQKNSLNISLLPFVKDNILF